MYDNDSYHRNIILISECEEVTVTSSRLMTQFPGVFIYTGSMEGKPVYANTVQDVFLYYHTNDEECSFWTIGPEVGTGLAIMFVNQDVDDPTKITNDWSVAEAPGVFSTDPSIRIVCV